MIISTNCASLVSAVTTVPTSAPSRRTVTRSVISRTSSRSCETKRTEAPAAADVADEREEPLDALPRQEDRRLVEDEHAVRRGRRCGSPRSRARSRAARARPASGRRRVARGIERARRSARRSRARAARSRRQEMPKRERDDGDARRRAGSRARSATRRARGPGARSSSRARGTARSRAAAGPARRRSSSSPASGAWKPARILISVDLPEPFSPRRPWTSPGSTSRSTPRSACVPPKLFDEPASLEARLRGGSRPPLLQAPELLVAADVRSCPSRP